MKKTIKRTLALALTVCILLSLAVSAVAAGPNVTVTLDGQAIGSGAYVDAKNRTQIPAAMGEALGMKVTQQGNAVTFEKAGKSITFQAGSNQASGVSMDTQAVAGYAPLKYVADFFGYGLSWNAATRTAALTSPMVETLTGVGIAVDTANKAEYSKDETGKQTQFGWYTWTFDIDAAMDTVGVTGDGKGQLFFRLYVPENAEAGKEYPLVATLGGLGATNAFVNNGYARRGEAFASDVFQAENPCYVLNITVPFEACVNYEAELAYIYQFGEIIKAVQACYGNVDMDRIYATGNSQGAGWSYELASVQPDLLAAILINAGTTIHTTWGNQCDMKAIADSGVNTYIWHGYEDPYIPVNEAYRTFNTLTKLGQTNIVLDIQKGGHCLADMFSSEAPTSYMTWLFDQVKGVPCTKEPIVTTEGTFADYDWAGVQVLSSVDGWATAYDYATRKETAENKTWEKVVADAKALVSGNGGTGKTWLSKVRIGDETATSYDDATKESPVVTIQAGDTVAVTVQGYTGGYGDDWDAFNAEWDVEWAVLEGSVTNIELTHAASKSPILRPETVSLANGGGPNVNNSLYNENALDGNQVYIKVDTAENFQGDTLKLALRFIRTVGDGEYASYWHVISYQVG